MKYLLLFMVLICALNARIYSQSVSINNTAAAPAPSSMLDVSSTTKGMLIPRMNKGQKNGIGSPATGLLIYQNAPDSTGFYYYDGAKWNWLPNTSGTDSVYWRTKGNAGLIDSTSFLGNIDDVAINFRVNNQKVGRFDRYYSNYSIGRGAGNPTGGLSNIGQTSLGDSAGGSINNNIPGVYLGFRSGVKNTGGNNTFLGAWTGENNVAGQLNTYVGTLAGRYNKTGNANTAIGDGALTIDSSGGLNVALGYNSMFGATSAYENTAIGSYSLQNHRINPYNVAVGEYALNQDTASTGNMAIGTSALRYNLSGNYNTAVGTNALYAHKNGDYNTAVGNEALISDTSGSVNVAVGWRSLRYNLRGTDNTSIGAEAMALDSTGSVNTASGRFALYGVTKGGNNTAMGYAALPYPDSSSGSIGIGVNAGFYSVRNNLVAIGNSAGAYNGYLQTDLLHGVENTYIGVEAGFQANVGSKNTVIGYQALRGPGYLGGNYPGIQYYKRNTVVGDSAAYTTYGNDNAILGFLALSKNITGSQNVAIGSRTLTNATAGYPNTAIGYSSMDSMTTGSANTAVGSFSLTNATLGVNNVAIGNAAMFQATGGSNLNNNTAVGNDALRMTRRYYQTAIGAGALRNDTAGSYNVAVGGFASNQNLIGFYNTAVGSYSQYSDSSGAYNTSLGQQSLFSNKSGGDDIAVGAFSLSNNTIGSGNIAIGDFSMASNTTGSFNTILGYSADVATNNLFNATAIGYRAQAGQSNSLILGGITGVNGGSNTKVGIGTTTPSAPLTVFNTTSPTATNAGYFSSNNSTSYASNGAAVFAENTYNGAAGVTAVLGKTLNTTNGYGYGGYFLSNGTGIYVEASPGNTSGLTSIGVQSTTAGITGANNFSVYSTASGGTNNIGFYAYDGGAASTANYGVYSFVAGSGPVNYGVYGYAGGATTNWAGYFSGNVFATTYTSSDEKLKTNIKEMDNSALQKVLLLKPKTYDYLTEKYSSMNLPSETQMGFIAQDVEKIFPALVKTAVQPEEFDHTKGKENIKLHDAVTFKALNYTGLIPVLTKAIQEQQETIDKQQKMINDLLQRVEKLEHK